MPVRSALESVMFWPRPLSAWTAGRSVWASNAPMSHGCGGRTALVGGGQRSELRAVERLAPGESACVRVGPPLSAIDARCGSALGCPLLPSKLQLALLVEVVSVVVVIATPCGGIVEAMSLPAATHAVAAVGEARADDRVRDPGLPEVGLERASDVARERVVDQRQRRAARWRTRRRATTPAVADDGRVRERHGPAHQVGSAAVERAAVVLKRHPVAGDRPAPDEQRAAECRRCCRERDVGHSRACHCRC